MNRIARVSKESKIAFGLLMLVLLPVMILFYPIHEEYEFTGDIVPVKELGIDGSVHFTYVYSGVTDKLLDKILLSLTEEDIQFTPVPSFDAAEYASYEEMLDFYKETTIVNAVYQTNEGEIERPGQLETRINEILEHTTEYGGDSLGLMVAIGLYEEAERLDFSKKGDFTIAGTGTINADRTIGEVGAIRYKLLAAERNNVDFFFVAKNLDENDGYLSNQEEAYEVGEEEGFSMMIVPVATLDEAISFLKNVQEFDL